MNTTPDFSLPPMEEPQPPKKKISGALVAVLVCGTCCVCSVPILAAILFPVFTQAKIAAQSSRSLSNLKQISTGWLIYSVDFDDRTCPVDGWNGHVMESMPGREGETLSPLIDPLLKEKGEAALGYGMNAGVAKLGLSTFAEPDKVIAFALTQTPGVDAVVTKDTLRNASSAPFRTIWAHADGSAKKALVDEAQRLQWKPVILKE